MISKTKINKRMKRKTNPKIVDTLFFLKKQKNWIEVAKIISSSTRKYSALNLDEIDKQTSEGDTVVVPGKVLGVGKLTKKIRIAALGFSDSALTKIKEKKSEAVSILEEANKNPQAKGIKIIR